MLPPEWHNSAAVDGWVIKRVSVFLIKTATAVAVTFGQRIRIGFGLESRIHTYLSAKIWDVEDSSFNKFPRSISFQLPFAYSLMCINKLEI